MPDLPGPGPELDALVAERVMGGAGMSPFRCPECGSPHFGSDAVFNRTCHRCHWTGRPEQALPGYSTDIGAAMEVVEKLQEVGWYVTMGDVRAHDWWTVELRRSVLLDKEWGEAAFLPHAISLAALKAVGGSDA